MWEPTGRLRPTDTAVRLKDTQKRKEAVRNKTFRCYPARVRPIVTLRDYEAAREVLRQAAHQIYCDDEEERVEALIREISDFEAQAQNAESLTSGEDAPSCPNQPDADLPLHARRWSDPLTPQLKQVNLRVRLRR